MTRATCHVQGHPAPLVAVDTDRVAALGRICDQLDTFGLAGRRVRIAFDDADTERCAPPLDVTDPPELRVYLDGTRGDWVSAVRVLSYVGGVGCEPRAHPPLNLGPPPRPRPTRSIRRGNNRRRGPRTREAAG